MSGMSGEAGAPSRRPPPPVETRMPPAAPQAAMARPPRPALGVRISAAQSKKLRALLGGRLAEAADEKEKRRRRGT